MSAAYLPRDREVWLVFDLSNGDSETQRYVWWFDTEAQALAWLAEARARPSATRAAARPPAQAGAEAGAGVGRPRPGRQEPAQAKENPQPFRFQGGSCS